MSTPNRIPSRPLSPVTRAVRAAIATDAAHGAVVPPIHLSSTFAFHGFNKPRTFDYTRSGNPTRSQLAEAIAALENAASGIVTSTGMSAVTLALHLANPGDTIVAAHDCYGGTQRLLRALAKKGHFNVVFTDLTAEAAPQIVAAHRPRMVWVETPSNPLLRITDVRRIAATAHAVDALVVVDNTFLSPALQQPIALGADLVVHSTTKYLNGHSDVVGGAVVAADKALGDELAWWANCLGITGAPFDSYLTLRGSRTLHSRMRDHLAGAAAVVQALTAHPAVERVYYPGLENHPGHDIALSQQSGFGAMVSFEVAGGVGAVQQLVENLQCFTLAESLGGVESLVAHPATMTHASMDAEARAAAGISDSLVRLSIGIESADDLVNDLTDALDRICLPNPRVARAENHSDIVIMGIGAIGRELIAQVESHPDLRICALADSSGFIVDPRGFSTARLDQLVAQKKAGRSIASEPEGHPATAVQAVHEISRLGFVRPILVDATAADTSDALELALSRGWNVVLANKVPLAGPQSVVDRLADAARRANRTILHEATVGAGLPVIDTLHKLVDAGDDVLSIEGCPSGTLGFLFGELGRGERFSDALRRAVALGYTEPDPRVDLSGLDVARKALILARAIGFRGEPRDVAVESLVPVALESIPLDEFLTRLKELDDAWAERVNEARRKGRVLRYRARVTQDAIIVGLVSVRLTDPLGTLNGTDNQFTFTTVRYHTQPLIISGPGAGAAVTAAGVFNDLLNLTRARDVRARPSGAGARDEGAKGGLSVEWRRDDDVEPLTRRERHVAGVANESL